MAAEKNERGGYIYLPAGFPFSSGAAAMPGYEVVHAVFRRPVPWRDGFAAIEKRFKAEGRPKQALCGVELRCPAPMTPDGFHEFNIGYRAILEDWDIIIDSNLVENKKEIINFAGLTIAPVGRGVSLFAGNKYEKIEFDLEKIIYLSTPKSRNICTPDISLISFDDNQISEAERIKTEQKKRIRTINLLANIYKKPALIITLCKPTFNEEYLINKDDENRKNQVKKSISEMPYVASLSYLFPRSDVAEELIEVFVNADVDDLYGEDSDYEDYYGDD